ncbi:hypothetical protein [Nocardioides lianchengensis]|uniref:Uncharacterized protein n=1 Tax=Nocardioides lianchengensis TaxID=1045774 RepID=A0A1G6LBF2_9ACTN|nr:hypothetical protein [Nocardioides lianchengensis]NYG12632.1 hypothetical protein [Nocardioides lianchengensis]SDC39946.1 hypothetical protein SAMN05421872_102169 [Nocardioides lianchengensis]
MRDRFSGAIAGVGTTSGVRVVVGRWPTSPYGAFADAMVETATGHRVLLAPSREVADFVAATYSFDEVRVEPFAVTDAWSVRSDSLELDLVVGGTTALGRLLRLVPRRIATAPWWCTVTDPVARVVLRGVRTRGSAGGGRREYYGATGVRRLTAARGAFDGVDLGTLAPVDPPPRFGFSSTPRRPSVTDVVTTVVSPAPPAAPSR